MTTFWRHFSVRLGYFAASCIILAALLVSVTRIATPLLNVYLSDFEHFASQLIQRPVKIAQVEIKWDFLKPEIVFENVTVANPVTLKPSLAVTKVNVNLAILSSILHRQFMLDSLKISGSHLLLHQIPSGQIHLEGFREYALMDNTTGSTLSTNAIVAWIFSQPKLVLQDIDIKFLLKNGEIKLINLSKLSLHNHLSEHTLKGKAILQQDIPTAVNIDCQWQGNVTDFSHSAVHLNVDSAGVSLSQWLGQKTWSKVFANPMIFDHVSGAIDWKQDAQGVWKINLKNWVVQNADLTTHINADIDVPVTEAPIIHLQASFAVMEVSHISYYLPLKLFSTGLATWLRQAFRSGQVVKGTVVWQGKFSDFPYDQDGGQFTINGTVNNINLSFATGWPLLKNIQGRLNFAGRDLTIDLTSAQLLDIPLQTIHAVLPHLGKESQPTVLTAHSVMQSDLAKGLYFLQHSPLRKTVGRDLAALQLQGPMQLDLQLAVPLAQPDETKVLGRVDMTNATLKVPDWNLALTSLNGAFQFTENAITATHLTTQLFGQPTTLMLNTKDKTVVADMHGALNMASLQTWLAMSFKGILQGATHYHATLNLPSHTSNQPTQVTITSNLQGVAVNIPTLVTKKANEKVNFQLFLQTAGDQLLKTNIQYTNLFTAALTFQRNKQILTLSGGDIHLGKGEIAGQINLPSNKTQEISVMLSRLYIPAQLSKSSGTALNPRNLPPISLTGEDVQYADMRLGKMAFHLVPNATGAELKQFTLSAPAYHMTATGTWTGDARQSRSDLAGELETAHLSDVLQQWGFAVTNLVANKANVEFDLNWLGALYHPALESLAGKISLKIGEGRIINLSHATDAKMGLARILNVFSLQSLPRRLSLNFSDLFEKGYNFDSVRGDFLLANGNATTKNLEINGPIASIHADGRIGLVAKDFDMKLNVTVYVTSSLPVVATIAMANPLAGVATWLVGKAMSHQVSGMTTYHYAITGPWDNPTWSELGSNQLTNIRV